MGILVFFLWLSFHHLPIFLSNSEPLNLTQLESNRVGVVKVSEPNFFELSFYSQYLYIQIIFQSGIFFEPISESGWLPPCINMNLQCACVAKCMFCKVNMLQSAYVVKCMCCQAQKIRWQALHITSYTFHYISPWNGIKSSMSLMTSAEKGQSPSNEQEELQDTHPSHP